MEARINIEYSFIAQHAVNTFENSILICTHTHTRQISQYVIEINPSIDRNEWAFKQIRECHIYDMVIIENFEDENNKRILKKCKKKNLFYKHDISLEHDLQSCQNRYCSPSQQSAEGIEHERG